MAAEKIGYLLGLDHPAYAIAMEVADDLEGLRDEAPAEHGGSVTAVAVWLRVTTGHQDSGNQVPDASDSPATTAQDRRAVCGERLAVEERAAAPLAAPVTAGSAVADQ